MQYILHSVKVVDPGSPFNGENVDLLIEDGIIQEIAPEVKRQGISRITFDDHNVQASPGWFDFLVHFYDPGHEYREGLENGLSLLANAGFTGAGLVPNTNPVIQRKGDIAYVKAKSNHHLVDLLPYGAITLDCKGEELTEMIDMHQAGAAAFTDGTKAIENADILLKTLLYLQKFEGVLIQKPEDARLNLFGSMHEGHVSTRLGLKGMPAIAETLVIQRDLKILEYTGGKLHFSGVSSAESVAMIAAAKEQGLAITCDVSVHHLLLDDHAVKGYDTNSKVNPPLRSAKDRLALIEGVRSGTIDVIASHHIPQDEERKKMEFDLAAFGMIGIQSFFSGLVTLSKEVSMDRLLDSCFKRPREILGIKVPAIAVGEVANLSLFDPEKEWLYDQHSNLSCSANSPFIGKSMKGQVLGTVHGEHHTFEVSE